MPPPSPSTAPTVPAPTEVSRTATKKVVMGTGRPRARRASHRIDLHEPAIELLQHLAGVPQIPRVQQADVAEPSRARVVVAEEMLRHMTGDLAVRREPAPINRAPDGR